MLDGVDVAAIHLSLPLATPIGYEPVRDRTRHHLSRGVVRQDRTGQDRQVWPDDPSIRDAIAS